MTTHDHRISSGDHTRTTMDQSRIPPVMERLNAMVEETHIEHIDEVADHHNIDTRAEALRTVIERSEELDQQQSTHDQQVTELNQTVTRLRNEKKVLINERQEKNQLANVNEEQQAVLERVEKHLEEQQAEPDSWLRKLLG